MAEKYELDRWAAVVCNGFTAVNVMSSGNVEELGWDYTEMELDPTGTCGLFDGMLLDWDDDTPAERRDHEAYFPDAFTVGARILADDWDHELGNDEVRSRCFAINVILNFSPITHAPDVDGRKLFCHETTIGYDLNADSWSGATIGPDFWALDGKEAREFAEKIGLDRLAARACVRLGIEAPGLTGREALPIPKGVNVAPQPSAQAEAAKAAATKMVSGETGGGKHI